MADQPTGADVTPAAGEPVVDVPVVEPAVEPAVEAPKEISVPLDVVTALKDELKSVKGERDQSQQELDLFKMNSQFQQPAAQPTEPAKISDPFGDAPDDELLNAGDVRKALAGMNTGQVQDPAVQTLTTAVAEMQLQLEDSNYKETIKQFLPEMINLNPVFAQALRAQANDPLTAMRSALAIAKMNPKYAAATTPQETPQPNPLEQLTQILDNANKPGSPSQVGGSNAIAVADKYGSMTDDEFEAYKAKVISGQ